jgi:hypothetical protein
MCFISRRFSKLKHLLQRILRFSFKLLKVRWVINERLKLLKWGLRLGLFTVWDQRAVKFSGNCGLS